MLSCRIDLTGAGSGEWSWRNGRLVSGPSWVQPIDHHALTTAWTPCRGGGRLVIVERDQHGPTHPDSMGAEDRTVLEIMGPQARLTAGIGGTVPVLLTVRHGVLYGGWSLTELAPHIDLDRILDRAMVRLLTRQAGYSYDTAFVDLYRLTERATATASRNGIVITYPTAAEHVLVPRAVRPDIDPVTVFDRLLAEAVARVVPSDGTAVGIELSGGLDSANVALTLSRHTSRLTGFGLLLDDLDPASAPEQPSPRAHHASRPARHHHPSRRPPTVRPRGRSWPRPGARPAYCLLPRGLRRHHRRGLLRRHLGDGHRPGRR